MKSDKVKEWKRPYLMALFRGLAIAHPYLMALLRGLAIAYPKLTPELINEFPDRTEAEYTATNIIAENMYAQCNLDRGQYLILKKDGRPPKQWSSCWK